MRSDSSAAQNQDNAEIIRLQNALVLVVADGAGGMENGYHAARQMAELLGWSKLLDHLRQSEGLIHEAYFKDGAFWSHALLKIDRNYGRYSDAGQTTCVVAAIHNGHVVGASVGDSSAWLINGNDIVDLTEHQHRRPLMGTGDAVPVGFGPFELNGALLLATDGLLNYAKEEDIVRILRESKDADQCAEDLIDSVRLPSGALWDDTTVIVCFTDSLANLRS